MGQATAAKPLTKPEILKAVLALGYKFAASKPINSLNALLYKKGLFKRANGRFSPR